MARPFMQHGVGQLESLFANSKADLNVLKQLEHELHYRQVPRAVALLTEVQAAIHGASSASPPNAMPPDVSARPPVAPPRPPMVGERPPARPPDSGAPAAPVPAMPLEDAYKLLKATAGSTWESIEQTRRQLVQRSAPQRVNSMSAQARAQALADAKLLNAAYALLSQARCGR